MKLGKSILGISRPSTHALMAALAALLLATSARAQAFFSFEDGLEGWTSGAGAPAATSTFGATDGTQALLLSDIPSGFLNDLGHYQGIDGNITAATHPEAFQAFSLAAAEVAKGNRPKLEFDFTLDATNATGLPAFTQLALYVNSTGGFKEYATGGLIGGNLGESYPILAQLAIDHGVTLTNTAPNQYHVAIPLRLPAEATGFSDGLTLGAGSHYYQIGFKANSGYVGTINYGFDNFRFTGIPQFTSHTLFSWETPDNPGTPGVNEQFEGWVTRNEVPTPPPGVTVEPGHAQSITSVGATEGTMAYQIDRTSLPNGFTWGSQFGLSGVGNPADQARIDDLVSRINNAHSVAFDVTFQDQFPISPTFTNFAVHFADGTGAFYQASTAGIQINGAAPGTKATLEIPISAFNDAPVGSTKNLAVDGLMVGATFLEIGIATSTDGGAVYQIDNFRLLTEVSDLLADFNDDMMVDDVDLDIWRTAFSATAEGDADGDGDSDGNDFLIWQRELGSPAQVAAAGAVPEPAAWMLAVLGALPLARRRRG